MADENIETLSVSFKFIKESLEEIKQAHAKLVEENQVTQDKIKEVVGQSHIDLKAMEDDYVKHRVELSAKATEAEIKHRKELLESMKRQVLESTGDLTQKETILKPLNEDIDHLNEKLEKTKDHLAGIKNVVKETSEYTGISGSTIAEIGSIGGLIALAFTAIGEIRRYERVVAEAEAQSGVALSNKQLAGMASYTKSLTDVGGLNLSEQEAQGVVSGLLGIRGMGPESIQGTLPGQKESFGERVVKMGESIGEGPGGAIGIVKTMMDHLKVPITQVESEFDNLRKTSVSLGDAHMEYLHAVVETADSMRIYNVSLGTTSDVLANFWGRIQRHEISMEQVTGLLKLGATENMGQLAYGGALAAQHGSPALRTALSGKNALQQADIMQQMLEGVYGENDNDRKKNQEDILQFYGQQALSAGPDRITQAMMFKTLTGRDIFSGMRADQQEGFLADIASGKITDAERNQVLKSGKPASLDTIADKLEGIHDPIKEITQLLKDIAQLVGGLALTLVGWVMHPTGDSQLKDEGEAMVLSNFEEFKRAIGYKGATPMSAMGAPSGTNAFGKVSNPKELSTLMKAYADAKAHGQTVGADMESGEAGVETFMIANHIYLHYPDGHIEKMVNKTMANKNKHAPRAGVPS